MAGHFLTGSAPPELLRRILDYSESARDVLSFALTCRYMSDVWHAKGAGHATVWRLWLRTKPYADLALILVRANKAVANAERKGELPPKAMQPATLVGKHLQPTASELTAVLQMYQYVNALTLRFERGNYRFPLELPGGVTPETPDRLAEWRDGVHRAIFRALIITAGLVGAYSEPLFEAHKSADSIVKASTTENMGYKVSDEVSKFLHGFPVYQLHTSEAEDNEIFGTLGEWLYQHILADTDSREAMQERFAKPFGRAMECQLRGEDCPLQMSQSAGSHSDAHLVALEIMRVLWMCANITEEVTKNNLVEDSSKSLRRIGPIALFGDFRLRMIDYTKESDAGKFGTEFLCTLWPDARDDDYKRNMLQILEWIHEFSGEPNAFEENDAATTPLRLKFFEYCFRRYVGAVFFNGLFYEDPGAEINDDLETFLYCTALFSMDDIEIRQHVSAADGGIPIYGSGDLLRTDILDGSEILESATHNYPLYFRAARSYVSGPKVISKNANGDEIYQVGSVAVEVVDFNLKKYSAKPLRPTLVYNCAFMPSICRNVKQFLGSLPTAGSEVTFHADRSGSRKQARRMQACPKGWANTRIAGVPRCPHADQPDWTGYFTDNATKNGPFRAKIHPTISDKGIESANRLARSWQRIRFNQDGSYEKSIEWFDYGAIMSCDEFPAATWIEAHRFVPARVTKRHSQLIRTGKVMVTIVSRNGSITCMDNCD
ncbi:hypothetical protein NLG97_g4636 [Lecanicillium saksenae]|uniref:Uncharacterized protein n=1 Tax=Lecanicillium saksenae TaxID=468837 RepID=A0ACC1QUR2_9HYPO|nr:hypothetical protein NLG97_g4636 [Lecanicillium saksenae]